MRQDVRVIISSRIQEAQITRSAGDERKQSGRDMTPISLIVAQSESMSSLEYAYSARGHTESDTQSQNYRGSLQTCHLFVR